MLMAEGKFHGLAWVEESFESVVITCFSCIEVDNWGCREVDNHGTNSIDNEGVARVCDRSRMPSSRRTVVFSRVTYRSRFE